MITSKPNGVLVRKVAVAVNMLFRLITAMIDINIKPVGDNANRFFVLEAR